MEPGGGFVERKETFDAVAADYDKYRPTYPQELFSDLLSYAAIDKSAHILEIGCGTGQATAGLIEKGFTNITCIELGRNLAEITREKFKAYPALKVINSSFEDWQPKDDSFDLAVSATAFHFIDPTFGYKKVGRLLKRQGSLGFFWTVHVPSFDALHSEMRRAYQNLAPALDDAKKPRPAEVIEERRRFIKTSGLFKDIVVREYKWIDTYSQKGYLSLLNTHSKHQQLRAEVRKKLFADLKTIIDAHGGQIEKEQLVALFLARKK